MSCSPFDLQDYFLQELTDPERRQVEAHVQGCSACRQELERLRLTQAALFSLRDEEIPQRIAFVSDPVFEPSRWKRGWAALWDSPARLGFAGAAVLAAGLMVSAGLRALPSAGVTSAEVDERIHAAVTASEARTTKLVHEVVEQGAGEENRRLLADIDYLRKENYKLQREAGQYVYRAAADQGAYDK